MDNLLKADAEQITAGDVTPYQQAIALQAYFLANFKYTLTPKISGTGVSAIESFLQTKQGFCQQFAATMAAMARALGIPAVVAVGYTPGAQLATAISRSPRTMRTRGRCCTSTASAGSSSSRPRASSRAAARPGCPGRTRRPSRPPRAGAAATSSAAALPTSSATTSKCGNGTVPSLHHVAEEGETGNCGSQTAAPRAQRALRVLGTVRLHPTDLRSWFLSGILVQMAAKLLLLLLILAAARPASPGSAVAASAEAAAQSAANGGPKPKPPGRKVPGRARPPNGAR